jgi:hypothetical protein
MFFCLSCPSYGPHCKENPLYVFLFWEYRGLSPNFYIHVPVNDVHIPTIRPPVLLYCVRRNIKNVPVIFLIPKLKFIFLLKEV